MNMKQLMMAAVLAVMTLGAQAQDKAHEKKSATERAAVRTERMAKELGLSADQQARVKELNLRYAKEAEVRHADDQAKREVRHKEMRSRKEAYDAELKGMVSDEQYVKWRKMQEARKARHKEMRKAKQEHRKESLEVK